MRVGRPLSASPARGSPGATPALAYWSLPTGSPLQVVYLILGFVYIYVYTYMHVRAGADTLEIFKILCLCITTVHLDVHGLHLSSFSPPVLLRI